MHKQVKRALRATRTNPKRRTRCRGVSLSCSAVLQVEKRRTPRSPKGSEGAERKDSCQEQQARRRRRRKNKVKIRRKNQQSEYIGRGERSAHGRQSS